VSGPWSDRRGRGEQLRDLPFMSEPGTQAPEVRVHRYIGSAMPVNAYLVETAGGVVVVDSTLTVSDARGLRERAAASGKSLRAVLITHAHPDHYGGCVELVGSDEIPIVAATGVDAVIRRDDAIKEQIIRPMFGDDWPRERRSPTRRSATGSRSASTVSRSR
jgi:glyoxylase-like metal-dependent hydrolase (beta-lactamase superfamily II)